MADIFEILKLARSRRAADVHIVSGSPVVLRVEGELAPITRDPLSAVQAKELTYALLSPAQIAEFERTLDLDFMANDDLRDRYRVNVSFNDGAVGSVIRLLPRSPMLLAELYLPPIVEKLTRARKGLILITGSTSQGKSTTMAAMIGHVNELQRRHIITIEDPIEYVHDNKKSIVRQREVGKDTQSFTRGLRAALRQDPDVIAVGEMRDYDTIKTALAAAETGVLVFSTMHIISIDKIIERLLSYAPDGSDGHMRALIGEGLLAVIHQELLATTNGGKRIACEVLIATDAVRNVMRRRDTYHLRNVITTGQRYGMQTMKTSMDQLRDEGLIDEALHSTILENYR